MTARVLGVELALLKTGVARVDGTFATIHARGAGYERHYHVVTELLGVLEQDGPDLAVLEDYAPHGPGINALITVAEVNGIFRSLLQRRRQPFALVRPSTLKAFAVGKGNAPKSELYDAARAALELDAITGRVELPANYDEADAYWLRRMGAAHVGLIDETRPRALEALAAVAWPDTTAGQHR
jgi:Holliday junction resolvasome RuvABC endonuclease subunit